MKNVSFLFTVVPNIHLGMKDKEMILLYLSVHDYSFLSISKCLTLPKINVKIYCE